jgi:DNA-binding LacI/PurR family transcriptional regulator
MTEESEWRDRRRVTLADVAARAGVSRALVSIVMREAPGASAVTRERILAAARDLGYRPDLRARSLAGTRSRIIGVLFGRAGQFHFELLEGLYAAAEDHGYGIVLSALTRGRGEAQALESLNDFRFDALVMLGPAAPQPLLTGKVPLVVVGWHVDDLSVDVVRTSDDQGMALAVEHLVQLGHRRIAHIDGGDGLISASRRNAFVDAMRANGLESQALLLPGGETQLEGQRAARQLLRRRRLPTAVIGFNDDVAAAAMSVFAQQDIHVPQQISVVGWDDSVLAGEAAYRLTSVGQLPQQMARLAVERLVARCEDRTVDDREIVLEPHLKIRTSSGSAPS